MGGSTGEGSPSAGDDGNVRSGAVLAYQDNGDGTIADVNTGLRWEKKVGFNGQPSPCSNETGSCANPHDADNLYTWLDGSADGIFLEQKRR